MLRLVFCLSVLLFALFHFAENSADPDLWGHVLFGQRMLGQGTLDRVEPFSWTAPGHPWINHEVLAEIALGWAHMAMGGAGLLLLKLFVGMLTFWIALSLGGRGLDWPKRATAWFVGLIAVVEISFGFAARPQVFTALGLACELWILKQIHGGRGRYALALPVLFALWINTHGGVVAGFCVLLAAAGGSTVQVLWSRLRGNQDSPAAPVSAVPWLWLGAALAGGALCLNPWGAELPRWLVASILWRRPEIEEWTPAVPGLDHAPLFILILLTAVALVAAKRGRALWEVAVLALLCAAALRYVRNSPLFAVAVLSLVPPYLADMLSRAGKSFSGVVELLSRTAGRWIGAAFLLLLCGLMLRATFTLHKVNGLTMEVPADQYPVAAVRFMQEHGLSGNLLVFFDWGEMCLWELPDCPPSIDGRLDTCYPPEVISANWRLYNGEAVDPKVLDLSKAELALLPRRLAGVSMLIRDFGWKAVHADPLAVVLVRDLARFPAFSGLSLPVMLDEKAVAGREPFPDRPSVRVGL